MRYTLALFTLLVASLLSAQSQAPGCFFAETFDGPGIPAGWDIGPGVLQLGPNGDTLGGTVDAWRVGNASQANMNGFFPVPNVPLGNTFIMANDDAVPFNCDLNNVILSSPSVDFTSRTGSVLEYRIFHEGRFGVGDPTLEVSTNGGAVWNVLENIDPVLNTWQNRSVDMVAFDGFNDVMIRFVWSDSLNWAGGVAVDDVCFSERFNSDVTLVNLFSEEIADDAFNPAERTLEYTTIPLTQVSELTVGAEVVNRGLQPLTNVVVNITVTDPGGQVGIFSTPAIGTLQPGESQRVFMNTGYTPTLAGTVDLMGVASHSAVDDDTSDDTGSKSFDVTQPNNQFGFSLMGTAGSTPENSLSNDSNEVGMGILIETLGVGDEIFGVGLILDPATAPGTLIQAVLLDETLQGLDTSSTVIIDQSHIDESSLGNFMFLPFDTAFLVTQDRDLYIMVYSDEGPGRFLSVSTSGTNPIGAALFFQGINDTWEFPLVTPMMQAYFSNPLAVGIPDDGPTENVQQILVYPNPANDRVRIKLVNSTDFGFAWEIYSSTGQVILNGRTSNSANIDVSNWKSGSYAVRTIANGVVTHQRFLITR